MTEYRTNASCDCCAERARADAESSRKFWRAMALRLAIVLPVVVGLGACGHHACVMVDQSDARVEAIALTCRETATQLSGRGEVSCGRMIGAKLVVEGNIARCVCPEKENRP